MQLRYRSLFHVDDFTVGDAIVSIILVGLFIYVASVDKKISKLENGAKD